MNLIATVDRNWGIGAGGSNLVTIPAARKLFEQLTLGKTIIIGRKTFETVYGGLPLPGRRIVLLTEKPDYRARRVVVVHSVAEALKAVEQIETSAVSVVGGASLFRQFLPCCDTAYITKVEHRYASDAFCPNLDELGDWRLAQAGEERTCFDLEYHFLRYERLESC